MILVRNVFKVKFGKMRQALDLWKEGQKYMPMPPEANERVMTDLTGEFYTLVFESTHENLAALEKDMSSEMSDQWRNWYQKFCEYVDSGYREVYTILPIGEQTKTSTKEKAYAQSRT